MGFANFSLIKIGVYIALANYCLCFARLLIFDLWLYSTCWFECVLYASQRRLCILSCAWRAHLTTICNLNKETKIYWKKRKEEGEGRVGDIKPKKNICWWDENVGSRWIDGCLPPGYIMKCKQMLLVTILLDYCPNLIVLILNVDCSLVWNYNLEKNFVYENINYRQLSNVFMQ